MLDVKLRGQILKKSNKSLPTGEKIYQILINLRNWIQREEN